MKIINTLSLFEKAILEKLLFGNIPEIITLRRQVDLCKVVKREKTGFGFYTTFTLPENTSRIIGLNAKFGDVVGEIEGLRYGAGFLLYVSDGTLDMLEGYSYDEPWPSSINQFKLSYTKGEERDWTALYDIFHKRPGGKGSSNE